MIQKLYEKMSASWENNKAVFDDLLLLSEFGGRESSFDFFSAIDDSKNEETREEQISNRDEVRNLTRFRRGRPVRTILPHEEEDLHRNGYSGRGEKNPHLLNFNMKNMEETKRELDEIRFINYRNESIEDYYQKIQTKLDENKNDSKLEKAEDQIKDDKIKDDKIKDDRIKDDRIKDDRIKDDKIKDSYSIDTKKTRKMRFRKENNVVLNSLRKINEDTKKNEHTNIMEAKSANETVVTTLIDNSVDNVNTGTLPLLLDDCNIETTKKTPVHSDSSNSEYLSSSGDKPDDYFTASPVTSSVESFKKKRYHSTSKRGKMSEDSMIGFKATNLVAEPTKPIMMKKQRDKEYKTETTNEYVYVPDIKEYKYIYKDKDFPPL